MKHLFSTVIFSFMSLHVLAQDELPKEVTPQMIQQFKKDIEKQVPSVRQKLKNDQLSDDEIEFTLDTFRIERLAAMCMDIDYSTAGMNTAIDELTASYDSLLNKYYTKLLKLLSPEDKKILVAAQRAWIAFRDAEAELIYVMAKDEYSGGGTMQSMIAADKYESIVMKRVIDIFNYYDRTIKD